MSQENAEFFERVCGVFDAPIETSRLNVLAPVKIDAGKLTDFINAEGGHFYTTTTGQNYQDRKEPVGLKYVEDRILPFFITGQGVNTLKLFIEDKATAALWGTVTVWQDTEARTRLSPFILPSKRRQGYITEAYNAVVKRGDEHRLFGTLREVWAEISVKNAVSVAFYQAMGFETRGVINTPAPQLPAEQQERYTLAKTLG